MKIKYSALFSGIMLFLLSPQVLAADGSLAVEGTITDGTCTVLGAAAPGEIPSLNTTIMLGEVATSLSPDRIADGRNSDFYIYLKGCRTTAMLKNIKVRFNGSDVDSNGFLLLNTAPAGAGNIGIGLRYFPESAGGGSVFLYLNGHSFADEIVPLPESQDDITLHYSAYYSKREASKPVTAGPIAASTYYDIEYF